MVRNVAHKPSQRSCWRLKVACTLVSYILIITPAAITIAMSVDPDGWHFEIAHFNHSDHSLQALLEPNNCFVDCAPACGLPVAKTMDTGCATIQVNCTCSGGDTGGCRGCKIMCSDTPGWMPYAAAALAEPACASAAQACIGTCGCKDELRGQVDVALNLHIWVSAWMLLPFGVSILFATACCLKVACSSPCPRSNTNAQDTDADVHSCRHFVVPAGFAYLALTVAANIGDVVAGWLLLRHNVDNDRHSIGEVCRYEYLPRTGLICVTSAATCRAGAFVVTVMWALLGCASSAKAREPVEIEQEAV